MVYANNSRAAPCWRYHISISSEFCFPLPTFWSSMLRQSERINLSNLSSFFIVSGGRFRRTSLSPRLTKTGDVTSLRLLLAFLKVGERYGDFSPNSLFYRLPHGLSAFCCYGSLLRGSDPIVKCAGSCNSTRIERTRPSI